MFMPLIPIFSSQGPVSPPVPPDLLKEGQIVFRPSCPLGNHSPQFGCPGLIPGGIIVSLYLKTKKNTVAHWATKVPTLVAQ